VRWVDYGNERKVKVDREILSDKDLRINLVTR
jgi:hypothetical protein